MKSLLKLMVFVSFSIGATPAFSIINGHEAVVSDDFAKSVIALQMPNYDNGFTWYGKGTAFVIGPDLLMTVAHNLAAARFKTEIQAILAINPSIGQTDQTQVRLKVKDFRMHPGFKSTYEGMINDIAIIKLEQPLPSYYQVLKFDWNIDQQLTQGQMLIASGYGVTTDYNLPDTKPLHLRYVEVPFISGNKEAIAESDTLKFDQRVTGFCAGDSGGPMFMVGNGQLIPVGINSFVARDEKKKSTCRISGTTTRISFFREWIEKSIQELNQADVDQ